MKLTIEPTDDFFLVNGVRFRAWSGTDGAGVPVIAMVQMVSPQTHDEGVAERFAHELQRLSEPRVVHGFQWVDEVSHVGSSSESS